MAAVQIYRDVARIVKQLPLSQQIKKKIKYNVRELIIFRRDTPEEPKHSKFMMRREPRHQKQSEDGDDDDDAVPRDFKIQRWIHNGREDVDLLRELSMLSDDTKKKLFSSFADNKPVDTKPKWVDKFEPIKGRLLREKYQNYG